MSMIQEAVQACIDEIVEIRRDIHRHPETGRKEVRTSELVQKKLAEFGVDKIETLHPTAVVGVIHGAKGPGKCVGLRADMDALPVQEETGLPFASETPNVMHACGHDMHTSMLLGVAKVLCGMRDQFSGTVKLIFQHSEDVQPGGAKELIEQGVLENPHVDAIYAVHMLPHESAVGKVCMRAGSMTTSVDIFDIYVRGRGGHGSEPHLTDDPLVAACQLVVDLQQIVSRKVDPMETAIVGVGAIHAGEAPNVTPESVYITGVNRAYSEETRQIIRQKTFDVCRGVECLSGCTVENDYRDGYPPLVNDAELVALGREAVAAEMGEDSIIELERPMSFSEDFAWYNVLGGIPAALFMIAAGHGGDQVYPLHNPKCVLKEEAMPCGIRTLVSVALHYLAQ